MKNAILVTLLASTLGLGVAAVQANDTTATQEEQTFSQQEKGNKVGKREGRRGGGKRMERLVEELNLTDAQKAQMKTLHEARRANKGEKDKASREAGRAAFEAILTTEQLTKLRSLKKNHK